MNPFEMVVAIIFLVTVGRVLQTRYRYSHRNSGMDAPHVETAENMRLKEEVKLLKDRVQVLERVITDNHSSVDLDRQIEQLRDR